MENAGSKKMNGSTITSMVILLAATVGLPACATLSPEKKTELDNRIWALDPSADFAAELRKLKQEGADLDNLRSSKWQRSHRRTRLHHEVSNLRLDAIRNLVEAGAGVNVPDSLGLTPLTFARQVFYGQRRWISDDEQNIQEQIIRYLEAQGAKDSTLEQMQLQWLRVEIVAGMDGLTVDVGKDTIEYHPYRDSDKRYKIPCTGKDVQAIGRALLKSKVFHEEKRPRPDEPYYRIHIALPHQPGLTLYVDFQDVTSGKYPAIRTWLQHAEHKFESFLEEPGR